MLSVILHSKKPRYRGPNLGTPVPKRCQDHKPGSMWFFHGVKMAPVAPTFTPLLSNAQRQEEVNVCLGLF